MKTFRVTAERSYGIYCDGRPVNPFLIHDIFDPRYRCRVQERTWDHIEARSEAHVRAMFEAFKDTPPLRGFTLQKIEELRP